MTMKHEGKKDFLRATLVEREASTQSIAFHVQPEGKFHGSPWYWGANTASVNNSALEGQLTEIRYHTGEAKQYLCHPRYVTRLGDRKNRPIHIQNLQLIEGHLFVMVFDEETSNAKAPYLPYIFL